MRGHAGVPAHVVVLVTLGAARRRLPGRRRRPSRAAPEPEPVAVVTARATVVAAEPFAARGQAAAWQTALDVAPEAAAGVRVLNGLLHVQRAAAADPATHEVTLAQALAVRVGVGEGEQVAHGRWREAVELAPTAPRGAGRSPALLRSHERLAAVLGGRDVALACEELTLRARLDADAGRTREAALQLRVALEAALAELAPWGDRPPLAERLHALRDERPTVGAAANEAVAGGLDAGTTAEVERVLAALEGALRARTAVALA